MGRINTHIGFHFTAKITSIMNNILIDTLAPDTSIIPQHFTMINLG